MKSQGLVRWAKSVVGTPEGSRLESRWARESGIAPTTAWCAAFVAAGLRQLGVSPPSNPASVDSWFKWKGGENLGVNLHRAHPGDLLGFDWGDGGIRDHIAIYIGGGMMISGNDHNNSVGIARVPTGNLVGIIHPKAFGKYKGEPLSRNFQFHSPAERKKFEELAEHEGLKSGIGDVVPGAGLAGEVISGLVGDLTSHAEALMLNIALLGGGAFLIYYGTALLLGAKQPVGGPAKAAAEAAALAPK